MARSILVLASLAAICFISVTAIEKRQVLTAVAPFGAWPYGATGGYGWSAAPAATTAALPAGYGFPASAYGAWPYAWPQSGGSAAASIPASVGGKPVLNYMSASSLRLAEAIAASHPNKDTKITVINRA